MLSSGAALKLFGGFLLLGAGGEPAIIPGRKTQRLLAMIALGPVRGSCRESLTEALWPGAAPGTGRKAMATALWRLRDGLAAAGLQHWLVSDGGRVGLAGPFRLGVDAVAFEAAVSLARKEDAGQAQLAAAETLCTGEFMAGDADEWCLGRRAYYAALRADLHLIGLRRAREGRDWSEVVRRGQSLAAAEPLLEEAQQEVMRAHLALGNKQAALAAYRALERALASELGLKPSEETRSLRLAAMPPRFTPRGVSDSAVAALAAELRSIAAALERLDPKSKASEA